MKHPDPGVDVVIVNYKTPDDLDACMRSLAKHPPQRDHNVWIANVEPTEADLEVSRSWYHYYPGIAHVGHRTFHDNVGFNRAANEAGTWCRREVIALFNADVEFTDGVVDAVCDELLAHDDWAIAGPRLIDGEGRITGAGTFVQNGVPRHRGWHERVTPGRFDDIRDDCCTVIGAAFFVKRSVWDELTSCPYYRRTFPGTMGPMSECLHYYGDELCAVHATQHGHKLGYVGSATMVHKHMGAGRPPAEWTDFDRQTFERFRDSHPEAVNA